MEQFSDGITVNGITRKVNQTSKREFTKSKYTQHLANTDKSTFADKMRMADAAGDIVTVATGWRKDGKLVHPRKDNFIDFDHGYALIMAGENQYSAEIVVGITDRGEYVFYDVTNIAPDSYKIKEESHTTATTDTPIGDINRDSSSGIVAQTGKDVNAKLSDRDSDGRKLSDEQKKYFRNSVVRDADGNLKTVYHGSPADFNEFSLKYLGTNGTAEGYGFYFTDSKNVAESYARGTEAQRHQGADGMLYEVYLNITKPLSDTEVTMSRAEFKKFVKEMNKQVDEDGEPLDFLANYGDVAWEGLNNVINAVMKAEYDSSDSDVSMIHSIINGSGSMETVFKVLRKTTGYDGIVVKDATWGGGQTIYVAFHPEQAKNVSNKKPTTSPDIRYSDRDPEAVKVNQVLQKENAKLKEDVSYLKELLKLQRQVTGGTKFTKTSVEAAAGLLMKSSNAKGNKAEFAKILNGFYEYIAKGDDLTWEGVSEQAQRAVQWLQEHENIKKEIDGYAQDILREIRENRFYLDENQKKEAALICRLMLCTVLTSSVMFSAAKYSA